MRVVVGYQADIATLAALELAARQDRNPGRYVDDGLLRQDDAARGQDRQLAAVDNSLRGNIVRIGEAVGP